MKAHTFDISQEITEGSFEMRSKEKTLFFTFFARRASPAIKKKKLHKCRIQTNICEYLTDAIVNKNSVIFHWNSEQ